MCLAIPARITRLLDDGMGLAEIGGVNRKISLLLIEDAQVGYYVVVHVGFALERLDPDEAAETLRMFADMDLPVAAAEEEEGKTEEGVA